MGILLKTFLKRALPGVLFALAASSVIAPDVAAAQFRQLPALPTIPPSITFPAERDILQADLDRLKGSLKENDAKRLDYRRECAQRLLSNAVRKRRCSFLAQEIYRDSSRLRTEISALRNRFNIVERNGVQRRQSGIAGASPSATQAVRDRRPKMISDALSAGGDTWHGVLDHVKTLMARGAGDPAVRDVSAYLTGIHSGHMAADRLDNSYYKHGVRRALAGDHWSAALAFAQAARDTPDDLRVFESFADAAGRQHAGPACIKSGRCVSGNITVWVKRFGKRHERSMKQIVAAGRKGKLAPKTLQTLNVLRAITVYAAKKDASSAADPELRGLAAQVLAAYAESDRLAAVTGYIRLWKMTERRRGGLFLYRYGEASGSAAARRMSDHDAPSATASGIDDDYLAVLTEAFRKAGDASPFTGKLSQAQIIRLQR
ncbi:MAG: hypothetical protein ACI9JL_001802 [Paracoccaceae bacterium]|jgi:hypothetical protein